MKFSYTQFVTHDGKKISRPSVWVFIKYKKHFIFTEGIIDSGSDYIVLPIQFAGELGIKLDIKKKAEFVGTGKNTFIAYPSPDKITYVLRQNGFRNYEISATVYFAESQPAILLGNHGFLDEFKVILDGIHKEVEITK